MSEGYVYILSNASMPGLVKIGRSISSGRNRAKEIYQTGVPTPFKLEYEIYVDDCVELESDVHGRMNEYRVNPNREFFELEVRDAIKELTSEYLCRYDLSVHETDYIVDESNVGYAAHRLYYEEGIRLSSPDMPSILSSIPIDRLIHLTHEHFERLHQRNLEREQR